MGTGEETKCVFTLTSLQIGDFQSYHSDLSILAGNKSKKMYIFVDNRPWSKSAPPLSTYLWLTLYGNSPFANRKGREEKKEQVDEDEDADEETREACSKTNNKKTDSGKKWFSLIDAIMFSMKKQRAKKLHDAFYGFIVFEVKWANVRGISYLNELQTDTSFAIEAKLMRRWEFESIDQAVTNMSQWFSGSKPEWSCLMEYLDTTKGIVTFSGEVSYDASTVFSNTSPVNDEDNLSTDSVPVETDSPCCSRRLFSVDHENQHLTPAPDGENIIEATDYKDVLVLVRFGDRDLPFKLREVIMSDRRLLTLLEAGLPSWVLFLQSYHCLCHLYRPWIYLLARALYVMIPLITVVIGFYDLYKNVPVLKATASRLCGPLFDWVETWDMVSRIKYLGTMLFLHNVQKAVKWGLKIARGMQSFASLFVMPLVKPLIKVIALLLPLWNALEETVLSLVSVVGTVIGFGCSLVGDVVEVVLLPILLIVSVVCNIINIVVLPLFWILWEVLYAPIRVVVALANGLALSFSYIFHVLGVLWRYMSSIVQFAVKPYEVWNDLFSHFFRALRSILNGLVAFFAACNRHRLSIYNHIQDFIKRLRGRTSRADSTDSERGRSAKNHQRTGDDTRRKLHLA